MLLILFVGTLLSGSSGADAAPWMPGEHRALADSALRFVLSELGAQAPAFPGPSDPALNIRSVIWEGLNFGKLTARFARNDHAASRFQEAGKTVYEQLAVLSRAEVETYWNLASSGYDQGVWTGPVIPNAGNVVANYLLSHVAAMQFARLATGSSAGSREAFRRMLVYEAIAQGLLADAHASGHLLVPRHDPFQGLHPVNNRHAHDYYSTEGVFVVNGRHQAWEAFGDGLLTWYAQSYRQVLEACVSSLREVFVSYFIGGGTVPDALQEWIGSIGDRSANDLADDWLEWKDGARYYEGSSVLPSLNSIPMPVSATWSMRQEAKDERGNRIRLQYPQFREEGYHDPNLLDIVGADLYSRSALPSRFVPRRLRDAADVAAAAEMSRDAASVEYVQNHRVDPDYAGLLVEIGAGVLADDEESAPAITGRLGYGLAENIIIASHVSINAGLTLSFEEDQVTPATLTAGFNPGALPIRIETGYATTTDDFLSESGWALAAAYDLTSQVLGFTYIGVSVRARYGILLFDEVLHSASIQVAFH